MMRPRRQNSLKWSSALTQGQSLNSGNILDQNYKKYLDATATDPCPPLSICHY